MASEIELKQLVDDEEFIENMNKAFADLRADYELTMDDDESKINELSEVHVDVRNQLSDLSTLSRKSSGTICGLRGTGKTHLLLLARHRMNSTLWEKETDNNLCVYLNMKRLGLPENYDKDIFNRIFSIFLYEEVASQLGIILKELTDNSLLDRLISSFSKKRRDIRSNLGEAITLIGSMITLAHTGNECLNRVGMGQIEETSSYKNLKEFAAGVSLAANGDVPNFSANISSSKTSELSEAYKTNDSYLQYLNVNSVRNQLLSIINLLNIDSITFYVDEWEKISNKAHCQEYSAMYIDQIIDDPFFFWISIVPYRGGLYSLENGSDLQHQFNLDESLIYENSDQDRLICLDYFKKFINKRLDKYFPGKGYTYSLLFNNDKNLSLLVLASMGNTRDFGTMLLKCWLEYQAYRKAHLNPGRPYKYISQRMVISAIKDNGDKKYSNIEHDKNVVRVWNDIKNYCLDRQFSHFAIEETTDAMECLNSKEFSELIYHRLIHMRKAHVPAKDVGVENKLSVYAINYAATYSLHAQERKMSFVLEYKTIHDRVRRYIYDPTNILSRVRIEDGSEFPCISCKQIIRPNIMKAAWEKNSCPFCGGMIYNKD